MSYVKTRKIPEIKKDFSLEDFSQDFSLETNLMISKTKECESQIYTTVPGTESLI